MVGRIEAESGGGKTIRDEIDPEELNGNEGFRHAEKDGKEDGDDFSDVGGDKVSDAVSAKRC